MAVLVDRATRVLVQGVTGTVGREFARRMRLDGTPIVGGVSPGRDGTVEGLPVFGAVEDGVRATGANAALVCVPPGSALDAVAESLSAGIALLVVYTEGVSPADAIAMAVHARAVDATLLGPASAGVVSPGAANVSDLRADTLTTGPVGVLSKSGTLTYEVVGPLSEHGIGVSTVCCLGGDPVTGTAHVDVLPRFEADPQTRVVVLLGEIGGTVEADAAAEVGDMSTPVVAYVAGRHAPPGRPLGHAGALVASPREGATEKARALAEAGATVVDTVLDVPAVVREVLATSPARGRS